MGRSKISEMTWRQFYWDHLSGVELRTAAKNHKISQSAAYTWLRTTDADIVRIRTEIEREVWSVMNQARAEKLASFVETINDDYMAIMINVSKMLRKKTEVMAQKTEQDDSKEQMVRKREAIRGTRVVTERDDNGNPVLDEKTGAPVKKQQMVFTERAVENDLETLSAAYQRMLKPYMETMSNATRTQNLLPELSGEAGAGT